MRTLKFTLSNLFLWMTIGLGTFYVQNLALLTSDFNAGFDISTFWILTIACFICMFMYFFLEHKRNKLKIDKVLLPAMLILTAIMLAVIWMQKGETFAWENGKAANEVTISFEDKIFYTIRLIFMMACLYMCLYCLYIRRISNRSLLWISIGYLGYTLVAMVFSFIKETDAYISIIHGTDADVKSLFHNPNTYAMTLFIGMLACFVINYYKPNPVTYLAIPFIAVVMFFTGCATSAILSMVVVPIYFVFDIARHARKKAFKTIIVTSVCLFIFIFVFLMLFALSQTENETFVNINKSLSLLFKSFKTDTFTGRTLNWGKIISHSFDTIEHTLFGHGYFVSEKYIPALIAARHNSIEAGSTFGDNGFIYILYSTGLVGLIPYLVMIGYFGYCCVRLLMEKRFYFVALFSLCTLSMTAYNMMEANNFFDFSVKGLYITTAFFMPVIVAHKYLVRKKDVKEMMKMDVKKPAFDPKRVGQIFAILLLAAMGMIAPVLMTTYSLNNPVYSKMMFIFLAALAGAFVVLPYLVTLWVDNDTGIVTFAHVIVNLACIAFAFFAAFKLGNMMIAIFVTIGAVILDMVVYSLIRKDFFRSYFKVTFVEPLKVAIFPVILGVFLGVMTGMLFQLNGGFSALTCLSLMLLTVVFITIAFYLLPNKSRDKLFVYLNNNILYNYQQYVERGLL